MTTLCSTIHFFTHAPCLGGAGCASIEHGTFSPIPGTICDVIGQDVI